MYKGRQLLYTLNGLQSCNSRTTVIFISWKIPWRHFYKQMHLYEALFWFTFGVYHPTKKLILRGNLNIRSQKCVNRFVLVPTRLQTFVNGLMHCTIPPHKLWKSDCLNLHRPSLWAEQICLSMYQPRACHPTAIRHNSFPMPPRSLAPFGRTLSWLI